jgi:hypothetical protein
MAGNTGLDGSHGTARGRIHDKQALPLCSEARVAARYYFLGILYVTSSPQHCFDSAQAT